MADLDRHPLTGYTTLLRRRQFFALWASQGISTTGDAFYNLAVVWTVYAQTRSIVQTAIVQAVWQMSGAVFGPIVGALTDRWNRQLILVVCNLLSAGVTGTVAIAMLNGRFSTYIAFISIFLLNGLASFLAAARFSVIPDVVGRHLLRSAGSLSSATSQIASFVGNVIAGILVIAQG